MKLCSIDSSTNATGMCLAIDGSYFSHIFIDHHVIKDVDERMNIMIYDIISQLQKWKPDIVWIEQPQGHGRNVAMVRKLAEILGAVRCWCVAKNKEYYEIMPSEWRKYLPDYSQGGKSRNELKTDAINYVKNKLNIECSSDEADAICICIAVMEYYKTISED